MSITFSVAKEEIRIYEGQPHIIYAPQYPEGFDLTPKVDPEYPEYGFIHPDSPWELNVSHTNAGEILRTLEIDSEHPCGVICGPDLERIVVISAQVLSTIRTTPELDQGTLSRTSDGDGHATVIHCGHMPGWYENRFAKMAELASIAIEHGMVISYS